MHAEQNNSGAVTSGITVLLSTNGLWETLPASALVRTISHRGVTSEALPSPTVLGKEHPAIHGAMIT